MDDDIRNRFRGAGRSEQPTSYGRPTRPVRPSSPVPRPARVSPAPAAAPQARPAPAASQAAVPVQPRRPVPQFATPFEPPKRRRPRKGLRSKFRLPKHKKLFALAAVVVAGLIVAAVVVMHKKPVQQAVQSPQTTQTPSTQAAPKRTGTIRLVAVGDSLAFDTVTSSAKQADGSYNYQPMMSSFKPFFDKSDIRICNETSPGGGDKNGLAISGYPNFNAPLEWSSSFVNVGCNVMNLASDHINDKGQPAIDASLNTLGAATNLLAVAGANSSAAAKAKIHYFTVKDVKFAYLAYTTSTTNKDVSAFGLNQYTDDLATQQITEARKNAELIIVSMNWGTENSSDINPDQDRIAQSLATLGVDVIIGGGPRVIQPVKALNGKDGHQTLVWFSLGDFLGSQLPIENLIGGMAVMDFDAATLQIKDPKLMPTYMHYEWTPQQKAAGTVNARHDLRLYPLDLAVDALARSQNGTTVQAQTSRVTAIVTKFLAVKVIKSTDF